MSMDLSLETRWTPAAGSVRSVYELSLRNHGPEAIAGFTLGVGGPAAGIAPDAGIEGGTLKSRLSTWSLIAPPDGFVLAPGEVWDIVIRSLTHPLRHWSDGVHGAYITLPDGRMCPVPTTPPRVAGHHEPLIKGSARFALPKDPPVNLSIIPWPNEVAVSGVRATPAGLDLRPGSSISQAAVASFKDVVDELFPHSGLLQGSGGAAMPVTFSDKQMHPEAYEIAFDAAGAAVSAATRTGCLYGLVTLGQILRGAQQHPGKLVVPASGKITDSPALAWRGTHLDVARQFYSGAEISRLLKLLAWNKMNRFHWHLSDDEAWRVEIDAYPTLTSVGAWRGHGLPLPPLLGSGPGPSGGYYRKAEIRDIVALGDRLGIEIVPEIDIPGHCYAVLEALPHLRDPQETRSGESVQGFPDNCLNPAYEPVYRFIETVVDEILELFPSRILHIGADEVPLSAWSGSPKALALLEAIAGTDAADRHRALATRATTHELADEIEGSGTALLQAHFIARVHRHIAGRGAVTGGWEEAAHGGALDKSTSYLVGWRNVEVSAALAGEGYDIVVSPAQRYYLDMANGPGWSEPGAGWAGWSGPEETYRFDPHAGWSATQLQHLLGVQTCIWSESMADRAIFDRLVFPRISALAETGWTLSTNKSWERFSALCGLMPIMYGHWAA